MPSKDNIKSSVQETSPEDVIGTNMRDLFSRGNEAEAARYTLRRLTSSVDTTGSIDQQRSPVPSKFLSEGFSECPHPDGHCGHGQVTLESIEETLFTRHFA